MSWRDRIDADPAIWGGRPRVKGARLTVEFLLGLMAAGRTERLIPGSCPQLDEDDLRAVFSFAQAMIEEENSRPLPNVA